MILAIAMVLVALPLHVFAVGETDEATDATESASVGTEVTGLKDYAMPSDEKHAYDPFAKLETQEATEEYRNSVQYEAGSIIYKVNATKGWFGGMSNSYESDALKELGIDVKNAEAILTKRVDDGFFTDTYEITYKATLSGDVWDAVDALATIDGVVDAQPNYLYEETALEVPTDIAKNPGNGNGDNGWHLGHFKDSWKDLYEEDVTPGEGTIVAVIDTGVDYTHIDLAANMWVNTAEMNGLPGVDDDGNGYVDDIHGCSTVGAKAFHTGDPMDDNGHGTHVAGIIAMTPNNYEGGTGIAYGAKIMAIKAGQATGIFSDTDIAEAINYAVAMGADVINMSFGGVGRSFLVEEALSDAFGKCVLVAAAGNNGWPTSDAIPDPQTYQLYKTKGTFYPAGYTYVIGVMASDKNGELASFSNWDFKKNGGDGEYELMAPGVDIYSTLPGNQYASWDGTSMAAPVVSALAAVIRSKYTDKDTYSSRFIMGQLINIQEEEDGPVQEVPTPPQVNPEQALQNLPKPNIYIKNIYLFDDPSIDPANDGDGIVDAGETIDIAFVLQNKGGTATNVTISADAMIREGLAHPDIEWLIDTVTIDDVGYIADQHNGFVYEGELVIGVTNPLRFKVKSDTVNDTQINMDLTVNYENGFDEKDKTKYTTDPMGYELTFYVQRGKTISGRLTQDTVLTKDNFWIIDASLYVPKGVTLTIEAGTQVQFWGDDSQSPYAQQIIVYIHVEGALLVNGTEEEPVEMFPSTAFQRYAVEIVQKGDRFQSTPSCSLGEGTVELRYTEIINPRIAVDYGEHLYLVQSHDAVITRRLSGSTIYPTLTCSGIWADTLVKSKLSNFKFIWMYDTNISTGQQTYTGGNFEEVIFDRCAIDNGHYSILDESYNYVNCVFLNSNDDTSVMYPAGVMYDPAKAEYKDIFSYNGKKYIALKHNLKTSSNAQAETLLTTWAKSIGAEWACFESKEEQTAIQEWLRIYGIQVYIGLKSDPVTGKKYWVNGSTSYMPSEAPLYKDEVYTSYFTLDENRFWMYNSVGYNPYILLEAPDTVADEVLLTPPSAEVFWGNWPSGSSAGFTNNAMLNHLEDWAVENWTRFIADSVPTGSFSLVNNYWGTENTKLIELQLLDADTMAGTADILVDPYLTLTSPELETIYPFVTEIYLTDSEGNRLTKANYMQDVTVHVKFNRDMNTSVQPMVSYGPAEPYTDYLLEGEFVSPREWCSSFKLKGAIDQGKEYFRVKDAVAADDAWLTTGTDIARFSFEVTRTGAEALTMQAVGGENKIELSWMQDDYDTLAGYHIYRSTEADGEFERINSYLIPGTIREFVDTDVLPGVEYYYYFTVMGTDLAESTPSNVAAATAIDNVKPLVNHSRVTYANSGEAITLNVTASDNIGISYVKVFYRTSGSASYKTLTLTLTESGSYFGVIPASEVTPAGVEYYLEVSDGTSVVRDGSAAAPIRVFVDHSLGIYSVTPSKVDLFAVKEGMTAILTGVNFTDSMTLKVGGKVVAYDFISTTQLSFTIPENNFGRCDIQLIDGERSARLTNALTYIDPTSEAQITAPGFAKAREEIKLPISVSVAGEVISLDLAFALESYRYSSISFEGGEALDGAYTYYSVNGNTVRIAISAIDAIDLSAPIGYLVLTPANTAESVLTKVEAVSVLANAIEVETLVDTTLEIKPNFTLSGKITYYAGGEGIEGVKVTLNNGMVTYTDKDGCYVFTGITSNYIVITPMLEGKVNNAVTATDASLILQTVTTEGELDEYQRIAADVDGDGQLTAHDASYILQKSVGKIEGEFPGTGAEWTFVGVKAMTLTGDMTDVDFTGVLLGDVTGDWTATPVEEMD